MELEVLADELLMKRVCGRDVDAFRVLCSRYELRVFNFVFRCAGNRALAEDLLQETFWRVWQAARTFDPARGEFRSWLYRVALNATRSELGLKRYSCESQDGIVPDRPDPWRESREAADDPARRFERRETEELVAAALKRLSPVLRFGAYAKIAAGQQIPKNSVPSAARLRPAIFARSAATRRARSGLTVPTSRAHSRKSRNRFQLRNLLRSFRL